MANYSDPKKGIIRIPKWKDCNIEKTNEIPNHGITEPRFSNMKYDSCAYKLDVIESAAPGMYHLNDRTNYDSCFMKFPGYLANNEGKGILSSNVDIESELLRLNYINSKCPSDKYNPMKNCKACEKCDKGIPCGCIHCKKDPHNYKQVDCVPQLVPEYTREPKACNDTILNINRFEPLCIDVQKKTRIHSNEYIGQPTRSTMKDLTRYMNKLNKNNSNSNSNSNSNCQCGKIKGAHNNLDCLYEKKQS